MRGLLDTSVIVRYLTGDPPHLCERAASLIDDLSLRLEVTDVVIAETFYVLTSVYKIPRDVVLKHLVSFLRKENVAVFDLDTDAVVQALLMCSPSGRVSVADALTWAAARCIAHPVVYSFDARFPSEGVELRGLTDT